MIVTTCVKRRFVEIDSYLTHYLMSHPFYLVSQHKEEYLCSVSRQISEWYVQKYDYESIILADYYKKVNELMPIMNYLFRTKVVLHWDKMNDILEWDWVV